MQWQLPGQTTVQGIVLVGVKFAAPAGKGVIQQLNVTVIFHSNGAEIPGPGIVVVGNDQFKALGIQAAIGGEGFDALFAGSITAYQPHLLMIQQGGE